MSLLISISFFVVIFKLFISPCINFTFLFAFINKFESSVIFEEVSL